jgi:hypothetical protein
MAVRYAIATGNWSNTAIWNGGTLPTSADDVYSNNFTVTIDQDVTVLSIRNTAQAPAAAGGGFILNGSNLTVSATGGGFVTGATRLLTYTGSNCVLNGNIIGSTTTAAIESLFHNSTGALTINGDVSNISTSPAITIIRTNSTGTLNINGNIFSDGHGTNVDVITICTVNIVGNVTRFGSFRRGNLINITAGATVNITGDITQLSTANGNFIIVINSIPSVVNITGNVVSNNNNGATAIAPGQGTLNITGNVSYLTTGGANAIYSNFNGYISIVGTISTSANGAAVSSTGAGAINLFSGPFICSTYGFVPYQCVRMHLIPSVGTYFEFRDETTNGALSPGAIAPPTRMISPSAIADAPIASNVRAGIVYANGSQTGTCVIPPTASVAYGILVDNTTGSAVLNAEDIWKVPVTSLTGSGSIGARIKNISTVQSTGAQLAALL